MCGICGIVGKSDQGNVARMLAAMRHRGPDDSGIFADDLVTLGMVRLAIIDITAAGHQPMSTPDQMIWIVYNGEVYNFRSERQCLEAKGYVFVSSSDTEVILRMYEHYGDDFLLRLRGIFALAIYDKRRGPGHERLLLARDHLGIKPLMYAHVGNCLIFASELKAMLASGMIPREIDPNALRLLLTFGSVYQPHTMVPGVKMLLPAHRMIIEHGRERIEQYWSCGLNRFPQLRKQPYLELVADLTEQLREVVRLQLISDVPLGAFLSGGVDSSVLVAMMAREIGRSVKTFSVGFETEGSQIDESGDARRTAKFLGTDHTHVLVTGNDVRERICHIASSLDQPSVDGVNSYFVSLAARQGVTVAISGTGGDELYAGYPWFIEMVSHQKNQPSSTANLQKQLLGMLKKLTRKTRFARFFPKQYYKKLDRNQGAQDFLTRYAELYHIFGMFGAEKLLTAEMRTSANAGRLMRDDLAEIDELSAGSAIERVSGLCLRGYTGNQLLRDIDAVSMAHSLEVRVPYLDPLLVDHALSLPDAAKLSDAAYLPNPTQRTYRETGAKRILIDVGKPLLPKDFDIQPKRGFAMPFESWLNGPLRDVFEETLSERQVRKRGLLDAQAITEVKKQFADGRLHWTQPWLLMMIELWSREILNPSDKTPRKTHNDV